MTLRRPRRAWPIGVLSAVVAGGLLVGPAGAQTDGTGDPTVASLRQEADAASGAYFAALEHYKGLTGQVVALEAQLPALRAQEAQRLALATQRAVAAYEGAGSQQLGSLITSSSVLNAARQAQWLKILNAGDNKALVALRKTDDQLHAAEKSLRSQQQEAGSALASLQAQGQAIEAKLQAAEARERQLAAAAAAAAAASSPGGGGSGSGSGGGGGGPASSGPGPGSPSYAPTPGTNPHHNDPFLTCVRGYESGGNYGAYNPAGPYMGAYQFLQSTWDSAANHAGRGNLIGVRPDQASAYDQDDLAWALYQWQGKGPWAGDPC